MPELPLVILSQERFKRLPEYSVTLPTGTTIGKKWRAKRQGEWYLGEYYDNGTPDQVGIRWSRIAIRVVSKAAGENPFINAGPDANAATLRWCATRRAELEAALADVARTETWLAEATGAPLEGCAPALGTPAGS